MSDQIAIEAVDVHKSFRLPHERYTGLKQALIQFRPGRTFSRQQVLKGVSFQIKKGEFFGIVGRNGGGKSTLLKLLAQIYQPDSGQIKVNGTLTPFIELGVGFNPELTGRENVFLNGALLGFDRRQMDKMYDSIVEFAELEEFMDAKLKNYSSGMQVRLAFSVAIRVHSDILLLDEVLAVGDGAFQRKCYDYFTELKRKGATVVLVTHDMNAIRQYCDRAILIENGIIMAEDGSERIAQQYQRLFVEELHDVKGVSDEDRWGNGNVKATSVKVQVTDDHVRIDSEFEVHDRVESMIAGFTIYGPTGTNILEDNTRNKKVPLGPLKKGETLSFSWQVPNIFSTGEYSVSVATCDKSGTTFYDWLNNAAHFDVTKPYNTAGMVNPVAKLLSESVNKGKGK
jgi:ABC-2 type transport system ATP-binding protein